MTSIPDLAQDACVAIMNDFYYSIRRPLSVRVRDFTDETIWEYLMYSVGDSRDSIEEVLKDTLNE